MNTHSAQPTAAIGASHAETLSASFGGAWKVMPSRAQALPGSWCNFAGEARLYGSMSDDLRRTDDTVRPAASEHNHNHGPPFPRGSL